MEFSEQNANVKKTYPTEEPHSRAASSRDSRGFTIVLDSPRPDVGTVYQDSPLPFERSSYQPPKEIIPERLRRLRRLYTYGRESLEEKARNFYRQGKFMEDFEDDADWYGDFKCYFPSYQDLTTKQLRGYFSWRSCIRRGNFHPIASSAAYLYIYELLNGIGAGPPEEILQKLKEFETGYLDSGFGDERMRQNLHRWMLELAVVNRFPPELVRPYADPEILERDRSLSVLRNPSEHSDEEVFDALCRFGGKKLAQSPVFSENPDQGRHLFSETWRYAAKNYRYQEKDLFTLCFGKRITRQWHPLANAVYYWQKKPEDGDCILDECRTYRCRNGFWQVDTYEKLGFDKNRLQGFLRETDLQLRRYLKTGRYLKENPADTWAVPFIEPVIEADRQAAIEAARPKITIDLSGLDKIRRDAISTRDSLLTEEERMEMEEPRNATAAVTDDIQQESTAAIKADIPEESAAAIRADIPEESTAGITDGSPEEYVSSIPLEAVQVRILRALLRGVSADEILRENHLLPSIAADAINEALFDEIGDVVVLCEDDELSLMEDYTEEVRQLLGGIPV